MKMIFMFIDGIGVGDNDKEKNPFLNPRLSTLNKLLKNNMISTLDCTMGFVGLPQSATGQTALFTGVNAAKKLGRHMSGQPTKTLINIIQENNIFKELINKGYRVASANIYRKLYIEQMEDLTNRRVRPSVTSVMLKSEGIPFRTAEDFINGRGVYHDITGHILCSAEASMQPITPSLAAHNLYQLSRHYDFTLFEYFMTDIKGHMGDMNEAVDDLVLIDEFLMELLKIFDFKNDVLLITSDHGNIEDTSVKTHTINRVPFIAVGNVHSLENLRLDSLMDVLPAVLHIFDEHENGEKYENTK